MASTFAIAQFVTLLLNGQTLRFQNYFMARDYTSPVDSQTYVFSGFRVEGTRTSGPDNTQVSLLFPNTEPALQLLQLMDGGRLVQVRVDNVWLVNDQQTQIISDYYVGVGSTFDETTIEVRCRSAIDSVVSGFPRRQFNDELVGILPQLSEIRLQ